MPTKIIELTVEVLVEAVSCPGVWLCPEGEVSLTIFALDSSHQTARLPPAFPLLFRDAFYFRKTFPNSCSLTNMQSVLKNETIYCELVQWKSEREGNVLAQYLGALADVLFPPDTCASDGIDLLMKNTNIFPGILSPKIEVSTKVRLDEVYEGSPGLVECQACTGSPIAASAGADIAAEVRRQKPVCHSKLYHKNRCSVSPKPRGKTSQMHRPMDERLRVDSYLICEPCREPRPFSPSASASSSPPPASLPPLTSSTPYSPMMYFYNEDRRQMSKETDEDRNEISANVPRRRNADTAWSREMDLTERQGRVARVLESNYTGVRGRMRCRDEGGGREEAVFRHRHRSGPCVCQICRQYHQLFHVN